MTAAHIINALAAKYKAPEYAFLTEVRNSVGFSGKVRTADAMAATMKIKITRSESRMSFATSSSGSSSGNCSHVVWRSTASVIF